MEIQNLNSSAICSNANSHKATDEQLHKHSPRIYNLETSNEHLSKKLYHLLRQETERRKMEERVKNSEKELQVL